MQWHKLQPRRRAFKRLDYKAVVCAYFLVPEGLHQPDRLLHCQREGEVRSWVNLWHLDVLVAEVPLPLCVPTNLVLSEDVRDQVSWWEGQEFKLRDPVLQKENTVCQSKWKSYVHCSTVWNCPWGSRGNYKAAKGGDKEEVVFFLSLCRRQKHTRSW